MKITKILTGMSMALVVAGFSACSDTEAVAPVEQPSPETEESFIGGECLMSVNFFMEEERVTRAEGDYDGAVTGVISKGTLVDMLVFAIYDKEGKLLSDLAKENLHTLNGIEAGEGQNIIPVSEKVGSATLQGFEQGETYRIVAWAQSSKCDAYDFSDLENVTVSYKDAVNNDETRDAFCASVEFTIPKEAQGNLTVELYRPFAQINVGTTGADYRNSAITPGGTYYTYSSIELSGVATSINVVADKIGEGTEDASFSYAEFPAYYNMTGIPTTPETLVKGENELFLNIHLNKIDDTATEANAFAGYLTSYPTVKKDDKGNIEEYLTETFKYLSMCYVLVPQKDENGATLDNVKVSFSNDPKGGDYETYFEVPNVPVNRNWRTNILGGLYAPETTPNTPDNPNDPDNPENPDDPNNPDEPDDPENPDPDTPDNPDPENPDPDEPVDDPTSVFSSISCNVLIISTYNNSDGNYQKDDSKDNGYSEIK